MEQFVGLDVSVQTTSVCVLDAEGHVVRQAKVESDPAEIAALLRSVGGTFNRIGLEAGPLSEWLCGALVTAGFPVICVEARHMSAALSAQRNKTDRNDARGIAQMMRVGLYKPVHVKTLRSQEIRMLLTTRRQMQAKLIDTENILRSLLRNFGLKVGKTPRLQFEKRVRELLAHLPSLTIAVTPLLEIRAMLYQQYRNLHATVTRLANEDATCRLLMTAPGVGPLVSLTYLTAVDQPARFRNSRAVAAHFGLTPARYQSGEVDRQGHLSKCGDAMVRWVLVEAAGALMRNNAKWSALKAWGMRVAQRRGKGRAVVAVARRLAVILHRMWLDGTPFAWSTADESAPA